MIGANRVHTLRKHSNSSRLVRLGPLQVVMTLRSARVLFIPLIIVNHRPRPGFLYQRPYFVLVLGRIYNIVLMCDSQNLLAIEADLN